jgi:hypothetical protein
MCYVGKGVSCFIITILYSLNFTSYTNNGKISKDGKTTDITTLLTFDFPTALDGKTCSFHFDLSSDPAAKVSSTGQFDVFISLAPATRTTTTWPSGNLRDQHIGRMRAQPNAAATWVAGFSTFGQSFPCPAGRADIRW